MPWSVVPSAMITLKQMNFLQEFCFKTLDPSPSLLIEGLNLVRVWFFGLLQCSFVSLGISRMYLIYKVSIYKVSIYKVSIYKVSIYKVSIYKVSIYKVSIYKLSIRGAYIK